MSAFPTPTIPVRRKPSLDDAFNLEGFPQFDTEEQNKLLQHVFEVNAEGLEGAERQTLEQEFWRRVEARRQAEAQSFQPTPEQQARVESARLGATAPPQPLPGVGTVAKAAVGEAIKTAPAALGIVDYLGSGIVNSPYVKPYAAFTSVVDKLLPVPPEEQGLITDFARGIGQLGGFVAPGRALGALASKGQQGYEKFKTLKKVTERFGKLTGSGLGLGQLEKAEQDYRERTGEDPSLLQHIGGGLGFSLASRVGTWGDRFLTNTMMGPAGRTLVGGLSEAGSETTESVLQSATNRLVLDDPTTVKESSSQAIGEGVMGGAVGMVGGLVTPKVKIPGFVSDVDTNLSQEEVTDSRDITPRMTASAIEKLSEQTCTQPSIPTTGPARVPRYKLDEKTLPLASYMLDLNGEVRIRVSGISAGSTSQPISKGDKVTTYRQAAVLRRMLPWDKVEGYLNSGKPMTMTAEEFLTLPNSTGQASDPTQQDVGYDPRVININFGLTELTHTFTVDQNGQTISEPTLPLAEGSTVLSTQGGGLSIHKLTADQVEQIRNIGTFSTPRGESFPLPAEVLRMQDMKPEEILKLSRDLLDVGVSEAKWWLNLPERKLVFGTDRYQLWPEFKPAEFISEWYVPNPDYQVVDPNEYLTSGTSSDVFLNLLKNKGDYRKPGDAAGKPGAPSIAVNDALYYATRPEGRTIDLASTGPVQYGSPLTALSPLVSLQDPILEPHRGQLVYYRNPVTRSITYSTEHNLTANNPNEALLRGAVSDIHVDRSNILTPQEAQAYIDTKLATKRIDPQDSALFLNDPTFRPAPYTTPPTVTDLQNNHTGAYYFRLLDGSIRVGKFLPHMYLGSATVSYLPNKQEGLQKLSLSYDEEIDQLLKSIVPFDVGEKEYAATIPAQTKSGTLSKAERDQVEINSAVTRVADIIHDPDFGYTPHTGYVTMELMRALLRGDDSPLFGRTITVYRGETMNKRPGFFRAGGGGQTLGAAIYTSLSPEGAVNYAETSSGGLAEIDVTLPKGEEILFVTGEGIDVWEAKYHGNQRHHYYHIEPSMMVPGDELLADLVNDAMQLQPATLDQPNPPYGSARYGAYLSKKLQERGYKAIFMIPQPQLIERTNEGSIDPPVYRFKTDVDPRLLSASSQFIVFDKSLYDYSGPILKAPLLFQHEPDVEKLDASFANLGIVDTLGVKPIPTQATPISSWGPRSLISPIPLSGVSEPISVTEPDGKIKAGVKRMSSKLLDTRGVGYTVPQWEQTFMFPESYLKGRAAGMQSAGIETQHIGNSRTVMGDVLLKQIRNSVNKAQQVQVRPYIEQIVKADEVRKKGQREIKAAYKAANKKGTSFTIEDQKQLQALVEAKQAEVSAELAKLDTYDPAVQSAGKQLIRYFRDIWHDNMRSDLLTKHFQSYYGKPSSIFTEVMQEIEAGTDPRDITEQLKRRHSDFGKTLKRQKEEAAALEARAKALPKNDPRTAVVKEQLANLAGLIKAAEVQQSHMRAAIKITANDPVAFITNLEAGKFVLVDAKTKKVITRAVTRQEFEAKKAQAEAQGFTVEEVIDDDYVNPLKPRKNILKGTQNIFDIIEQYNGTINNRIARKPWEAAYEQEQRLFPQYQDPSIRQVLDNTRQQLLGGPATVVERWINDLVVEGSRHSWGRALMLDRMNPRLGGIAMQKLSGATAAMKLGYKVPLAIVNYAMGEAHPITKYGVEYMAKGRKYIGTPEGEQLAAENMPYLDPNAGFDVLSMLGKYEGKVTDLLKPLGMNRSGEYKVRRDTFFAGYAMFRDMGYSREAAAVAARKGVRLQQACYLSSALPLILKTKDRRIIGQFTTYMFNEAGFLRGLSGTEWKTYLGMMVMMGGPQALVTAARSLPFLSNILGTTFDNFESWIQDRAVDDRLYRGLPGLGGVDMSAAVAPGFRVPTGATPLEEAMGPGYQLPFALAREFWNIGHGYSTFKDSAKRVGAETITPVRSLLNFVAAIDGFSDPDGWVKDPVTGEKLWQLGGMWDAAKELTAMTPLEKAKAIQANRHIAAFNQDAMLKRKKMFKENDLEDPSEMDPNDPNAAAFFMGLEQRYKNMEKDAAMKALERVPLPLKPWAIQELQLQGQLPAE